MGIFLITIISFKNYIENYIKLHQITLKLHTKKNRNRYFQMKSTPKSVLLTSTSTIKRVAVEKFFEEKNINVTITIVNCDDCNLPLQPLHCATSNVFFFAKERMNYAKKMCPSYNSCDYIISIENGIDCFDNFPIDKCFVLIYHRGVLVDGISQMKISVPLPEWRDLRTNYQICMYAYNDMIRGYDTTIGELLAKNNPSIDPKNWMKTLFKVDRNDQIMEALNKASESLSTLLNTQLTLAQGFSEYDNFPKEGVLFKDMFPLFSAPRYLKLLIDFIYDMYRFDDIDIIVGLESRGFLLGVPLAYKMNRGFVPIRKKGKLPGETYQESYEKEYGQDTCEIQCNSISQGDKVLLIDDLIATGGSMQAAVQLVEKCGGIVVDCCVLLNVPQLHDQCNKTLKANYTVLIQ